MQRPEPAVLEDFKAKPSGCNKLKKRDPRYKHARAFRREFNDRWDALIDLLLTMAKYIGLFR